MGDTTATLLVPAYFIQIVVGTAILAWWFIARKDKVLKTFGIGMAGYSLGTAAWTLLVLTKPDDLQPLILAGAIPFLLANLAFAKVAYKNLDFKKTSLLSLVVLGTIAGTFIVRTFIYPSAAYFSDEGLLFFGLHPLSIAFYIATMSLTFLPAISVASEHIKKGALRSVMKVGITTLYINSIILVSGNDDTLLLINGVIMTIALLVVWVKAVTTPAQKI
jgi:hypothetical protein